MACSIHHQHSSYLACQGYTNQSRGDCHFRWPRRLSQHAQTRLCCSCSLFRAAATSIA
ncbi:unnamed protein product [Alopecurus aequalis]